MTFMMFIYVQWDTMYIDNVAVHLGVMIADTLSLTAKVDMVDFWV